MLLPNLTQNSAPLNSEMDILENPKTWLQSYQDWVEDFQSRGTLDWEKYVRPHNQYTPWGEAIRLSQSRVLLISSAGAYLRGSQAPFDISKPFGDYSIRTFHTHTSFDALAFAHAHCDSQYLRADPQVLLPLEHLQGMAASGFIGELAPQVVSFMGYQPNVFRVVKELIPAILEAAYQQEANSALLVPTDSLCIQSVGLIARALEVNGIPATFTSWSQPLAALTAPPRATVTRFPPGSPLGAPGDSEQQRRVLRATLSLLERPAPVGLVELDESAN